MERDTYDQQVHLTRASENGNSDKGKDESGNSDHTDKAIHIRQKLYAPKRKKDHKSETDNLKNANLN